MMMNDFEKINLKGDGPPCILDSSGWISFFSVGGSCKNEALKGNTTIKVSPMYRNVVLKF